MPWATAALLPRAGSGLQTSLATVVFVASILVARLVKLHRCTSKWAAQSLVDSSRFQLHIVQLSLTQHDAQAKQTYLLGPLGLRLLLCSAASTDLPMTEAGSPSLAVGKGLVAIPGPSLDHHRLA